MISFTENAYIENTLELNRAFKYGDGLFETLRLMNGEILFFHDHLDRLLAGMQVLKISIPNLWDANFFYQHICETLDKNNFHLNAIIRIRVWRNAAGKYLPLQNQASLLIEVEEMNDGNYMWNEKGVSIDFSKNVRKSYDLLSNIKTSSALIYITAAMEAADNKVDEMIVLNAYDKIADATSSNVFMIKGEEFITPSLRDAGVAGIFRYNLLEMFKHYNMKCTQQSITKDDLMQADEIFLTNVVKGIQPVSICAGKIFPIVKTKAVFDLFNTVIQETTE